MTFSPASPIADVDVVILGTGISGIAMAMELDEAGRSYLMLEKADEVGGTWRENVYPGVACDVPAHLYSFTREPNPYWSHTYASGDEIQDYLLSVVERRRIRPHIQFGAWLTTASYDDATGLWHIEYVKHGAQHPTQLTCRAFVLGVGALHLPSVPYIDGLHQFRGQVIHTAAWPKETQVFGQRVGVIGTGASAVQCIPPLAEDAAHLTVFQRTPSWVLPRHNSEYSDATIDRFRRRPRMLKAHRESLRVSNDLRAVAFDSHPKLLELASKQALAHLRNQVKDPVLREKLTPDYTMGCKRVLMSDTYYPALVRQDVSLITDGILAVTPDGVVTDDGSLHELDVLVLATGFDPAGSYRHLDIRGEFGRSFADEWADGVETYLGITMAHFPNLFMLLGPNTGLGHTSVIGMIEAQAKHIVRLLDARDEQGALAVSVRPELVEAFTRQLAQRHTAAVWQTGGCHSWYVDDDGVNRTLWPGSVREYEKRCGEENLIAYQFIGPHQVDAPLEPQVRLTSPVDATVPIAIRGH